MTAESFAAVLTCQYCALNGECTHVRAPHKVAKARRGAHLGESDLVSSALCPGSLGARRCGRGAGAARGGTSAVRTKKKLPGKTSWVLCNTGPCLAGEAVAGQG